MYYRAREAVGAPLQMLVPAHNLQAELGVWARIHAGETVERQTQRLRQDGTLVDVAVIGSPIRDADGGVIGASEIARDISEQRRVEAKLEHLADHDPLTGLLNRRAFEKELSSAVAFAKRYAMATSLVMLDIDRFKFINDSYGHSVGDAILRRVANLLEGRLRQTDVIARLGGRRVRGDPAGPHLGGRAAGDRVAPGDAARRRHHQGPGPGRRRDGQRGAGGDRERRDDVPRRAALPGRHRAVHGQGGGSRHDLDPRSRARARARLPGPPELGGAHPQGARGGQLRALRAADRQAGHGAGGPPRAAAAHADRARRAGRGELVPADRRALQPDARHRPVGDPPRAGPPRDAERQRGRRTRAHQPVGLLDERSPHPRHRPRVDRRRPTSTRGGWCSRSPRPRRSSPSSMPGASARRSRDLGCEVALDDFGSGLLRVLLPQGAARSTA